LYQSQTYDWKNRNWVGSTLPDGHFIFTYDDGPHKVFSQEIGDAWINAGLVKPTFFWLSKNIEIYPDVVKKINAQGYIIGSHSDRHADLGNLTKAQSPGDFNKVNKHIFADELINLDPEDFEKWKNQVLDREIVRAVKQLSLAIEKPVRYFRLPYGSGTKQSKIGSC
jgi:peptidoglycan/xylan/chitin deacetylase (PgdA/CDA1 family)